jgi:hypothetical protein
MSQGSSGSQKHHTSSLSTSLNKDALDTLNEMKETQKDLDNLNKDITRVGPLNVSLLLV